MQLAWPVYRREQIFAQCECLLLRKSIFHDFCFLPPFNQFIRTWLLALGRPPLLTRTPRKAIAEKGDAVDSPSGADSKGKLETDEQIEVGP